jgi:hypothetical protein
MHTKYFRGWCHQKSVRRGGRLQPFHKSRCLPALEERRLMLSRTSIPQQLDTRAKDWCAHVMIPGYSGVPADSNSQLLSLKVGWVPALGIGLGLSRRLGANVLRLRSIWSLDARSQSLVPTELQDFAWGFKGITGWQNHSKRWIHHDSIMAPEADVV